jgi:uncharacterized SAM-binding protein YcdF (DUF218 family)
LITPLRIVGWALLLLVVLAVGDFYRRTQSTFVTSTSPLPGVVFTGQFSRVYAGLDLLERGHIAPLLISGTNQGAGIPLAGFSDQFQLSATLRNALAAGTLVLSANANNTLENAHDTRHWLSTLLPGQPVVLITSRFHMPRASLVLEQALSGRQVLRYGVAEDTVRYEGVVVEFWKYLGTWVMKYGAIFL